MIVKIIGKGVMTMGILVIGAAFVDIKGFPFDHYLPPGRNAGRVEYVHGGVARNVVEDIANIELCPTFLSIVDDTPMGDAVVQKLRNHRVNTDYMLTRPDGMGTWLAVFDNNGDVAGSISKRPNMFPIAQLLEDKGEEIFAKASSVVLEIGLDKEIVKSTLSLAKAYHVKTIALVANMSIAAERRDLLKQFDCVICNQQEAGILFLDEYAGKSPEEMREILAQRIQAARIPSMVVTMGAEGAVYASLLGETGVCPARKVQVKDTTGAGDAFCAGVAIGMTYGKTMAEAVEIGTTLAASVITSSENVCPRFLPEELGIHI